MAATSVFVSGATGYIAQHVILQLIAKGYKVVGTVRSTEKGEDLKKKLKSDNFTYEIVKDIGVEGAFDEALKAHPEVTVFLHTASPFHFNVTDPEKDLLIPAVEGTKNALSAIATYGPQIKKVVVTSSYAAIGHHDVDAVASNTFTEDSWNEITWERSKGNALDGYYGSKTFAEKAAWDFVKEKKPNFTLSTVNPVYVFGPQAFASDATGTLNTSAEVINSILKLKSDDEVPSSAAAFIDVRDVAEAHLVAFENKDVEGQRLLLSSGRFTGQDILDIVNENFSKYVKGRIPTGVPGSGAEKIKTLATIDNSKTRKIIGHDFIGLKKTVVDTIQQVLDTNGSI
ncbi:putative NADPH-dependent methylglyoxal reductase Grp2p [[Candida] railenensis]|uniref:NADPH-dependent methylglyoxal reductase Grp2p n=1 Tax=[Candida] railenensis TaxID=45579 RepID=A0A9P0QKQ6_9ASCO|nr:putative NADPH-dependent methylglyoxal reductase Grp2p [[Candida] railenensis]